ncbi:MAG: hypothetical protein K1W00_01545 [Lachnospiraceae bacterium]
MLYCTYWMLHTKIGKVIGLLFVDLIILLVGKIGSLALDTEFVSGLPYIIKRAFNSLSELESIDSLIIIDIIFVILYFIVYKKVGNFTNIIHFGNSFGMSIKIINGHKIKDNRGLVKILEEEIDEVLKYVCDKKLKKFSVCTHATVYKRLLRRLSKDARLKFSYSSKDLEAIRDLKNGEAYTITGSTICIVTFKCKHESRRLKEAVALYKSSKELIDDINNRGLDTVIPKKKMYKITVRINYKQLRG